jgi:hypothetical protein
MIKNTLICYFTDTDKPALVKNGLLAFTVFKYTSGVVGH